MNTGEVKVSVIMPSLNVEPYIRQCLESVCNQTLSEMEILCVDAGSTDGTLEIIEEIAAHDPRIKVILSSMRSYGYQVNEGIQVSVGKYIGIVETDDFADREMFADLYDFAEKNRAEIVKSNYYEYESASGKSQFINNFEGLPTGRVIHPRSHKGVFRRVKSIWSGLYNREFLLENHIRLTETPGASYQDTGFYLKTLMCASRLFLTDRAYLHYRIDNEQSSVKSRGKVTVICEEYEAIERFMSENGKNGEYGKIVKNIKARDYLWNYHRIADEFKEEFLRQHGADLKMSGESKAEALRNCILDHGTKYTFRYLLAKIF